MPYINVKINIYEDSTWVDEERDEFIEGGLSAVKIDKALMLTVLRRILKFMIQYNRSRKEKA